VPTVEVILSPAICETFDCDQKNVVVVDIFRATSTIASALMYGAKAVLPVLKASETIEYREKGYLIAGERDGQQIEGFDFGNSPRLIQDQRIKDKTLALTTTNGTKCFSWAEKTNCNNILSGSFLNISATSQFLKNSGKDIIIMCAGWKNRVNAEDTLYAGALCKLLKDDFSLQGDGSLIASDIEVQAQKVGYLSYLKNCNHYQRLKGFGAEKDIDFSLQHDIFNSIILLQESKLILQS
jgi:2-phosphosulfolactate phosphatase